MKRLCVTIITLWGLAMMSLTHADHKRGYCPKKVAKMAEALSLTDAQVAKIKQLKQDNFQQMQADRKRWKIVRQQINDVVYSKAMNEKNLDAAIKIKASLMEKRMKRRYMMKHQIYNLLDPRQQQKYKEYLSKKWHKH